jgi:hypothetical protein
MKPWVVDSGRSDNECLTCNKQVPQLETCLDESLARDYFFCNRPRNRIVSRGSTAGQWGQVCSNAPSLETGEVETWRLGSNTEQTIGVHNLAGGSWRYMYM